PRRGAAPDERRGLDVALAAQLPTHACSSAEMRHGLLERAPERDRSSACRRGDLAEVVTELDGDRAQIGNPLSCDSACGLVSHEQMELTLERCKLPDEQREVLERAVVDVESEPRHAPVGRLQQMLAGIE